MKGKISWLIIPSPRIVYTPDNDGSNLYDAF